MTKGTFLYLSFFVTYIMSVVYKQSFLYIEREQPEMPWKMGSEWCVFLGSWNTIQVKEEPVETSSVC